jgi:hypothetical protein
VSPRATRVYLVLLVLAVVAGVVLGDRLFAAITG